MKLYTRGNVWWLRVYCRGKEHRISLRADARAVSRRRAMQLAHRMHEALNKGLPDEAVTRLHDCAHMPYVLVSGASLRQMKGPVVYAYVVAGVIQYIGMSATGLSRPLDSSHHIMCDVPITDETTFLYFPVATADDAKTLEARLIALLKPKWNNGGKPRVEATEDELREAVHKLAAYHQGDRVRRGSTQPPMIEEVER